MLDGIFGRGFASKCKSLVKVIKSRIDVIRRKRSATLKFLKKDIADLLANALDINAYGRVEGYIAELLLSSCYDFIEKCCDVVSKNVSVMQKLSDCPEDCKEAVSSLMFAAARFSDLPELRDLRQIFHGRYENSLDLLVNKQLVENSTSNPSTMEKKVKVMNDIASEFSIKWDSKAFERRMSKPPVVPKDQPKKYGSFHVNGDNNTSNDRKSVVPQRGELKVSSKEKLEVATIGLGLNNCKGDNASKRDEMIFLPKPEFPFVEDKPCHSRKEAFKIKENVDVPLRQKQEVSADKSEFWNGKDDVALKTVRLSSSSSRKRMERVNGGAKIQDDRENSVRRIDSQDVLTQRKPDLNPSNSAASCLKSRDQDLVITDSYADVYSFQNSTRKTHKVGESKRKPHSKSGIPPPYAQMPSIKSKDSRHGAVIGSPVAGSDINGVSSDTSIPDKEGQIIPPMRGRETDYYYSHEGSDTPIPRRRSSRRRHVKSASGHVEIGDDDDDTEVARRKPRSKRRDDSRRGLQILFDDEKHKNDEEERIIDRLLMHYCKKPSSSEDGGLRRKSRSHHVHHMRSDAGEVPQKASGDRSGDISKTIPRPVRSMSLPCVQTTQSEGTKVYARATSFQPDRSNAYRHVHPKLPDYDDLAAHFAAMKGI